MVWLHIYLCFMVFRVAWFCLLSQETEVYVPFCPKSKDEWKQRAALKKCSQFFKDCTSPEKFVYHCVINNFANATIEVCAPVNLIIDHRCAEFNRKAGIIVESYAKKCDDSCPFKYNSTEAYKYQVCYEMAIAHQITYKSTDHTDSSDFIGYTYTMKTIRSTMMTEDTCSESIFHIVITILALLLIISLVPNVWFLIKFKRKIYREKKLKDGSFSNNILPPLREVNDKGERTEDSKKLTKEKAEANEMKQFPMQESYPFLPIVEISNAKVTDGTNEEFLIIAIDIGEKYLGLAYVDPESPGTVIPLHPMERISVLIKKPGEIMAIGKQATEQYIMISDEDLSNYVFINEVKQNDVKIGKMVAGTRFKTKDILLRSIEHSFHSVWEKSNTKQMYKDEDIKLVLSAAGHWSMYSEQLIADVVNFRNFERNEKGKAMTFFLEKIQTVSPFIREALACSMCLNFNVDNLKIDGSTSYAVLNVGYGSCHLTFLRGRKPNNDVFDSLLSGGEKRSEWNNNAPEEKVWSFCEQILHEKYLTQQNHEKIKSQFDFHHEAIRKCQNDDISFDFNLPKDTSIGGLTTKEKICGIKIKQYKNHFTLRFQWKLLKECFKDLKNQVDQIIKDNKGCFEIYAVKCVFLVGGYNKLDLIQDTARKKWFPNITVVIPNDGGVCFAMGAASACAGNLLTLSIPQKT